MVIEFVASSRGLQSIMVDAAAVDGWSVVEKGRSEENGRKNRRRTDPLFSVFF
jgi:hypothetical protein